MLYFVVNVVMYVCVRGFFFCCVFFVKVVFSRLCWFLRERTFAFDLFCGFLLMYLVACCFLWFVGLFLSWSEIYSGD